MSAQALPATLTPPLSGREAVADALYRCVYAFDTADDELLKSSLAIDAVFDLKGTIFDGFDAIYSQCYSLVSKMDTTHFVTNLRINITEEDSKAQLTCTSLAQHFNDGEGLKAGSDFKLNGGFYYMDLVKDSGDGLWKIKHWTLRSVWREGDLNFA